MRNTLPLQHKLPSKAFSLIEAAIVLGIIGLVIGGIWVAAASISGARKYNEALQVYAFLVDVYRDNKAFYDSAGLPSNIIAQAAVGRTVPADYSNNYAGRTSEFCATHGLCIDATYGAVSTDFTVGFTFHINPSSSAFAGNVRPDPNLCSKLSGFLINVLNTHSGSGRILFYNSSFGTLGSWLKDGTTQPPSATQFMGWCNTTVALIVQLRNF